MPNFKPTGTSCWPFVVVCLALCIGAAFVALVGTLWILILG